MTPEIRDALLVRYREHDNVPALLGPTNREHADPRGTCRQRLAVGVGRRHIYQFSRRASDAVQEHARRGHRGRGGQIAHPR
jgi:hypothetical protein